MNIIVWLCLVVFCNVIIAKTVPIMFRQWTSKCKKTISINQINQEVAQVSKITCTSLCSGQCRRFIWDSSNSNCMLYSFGADAGYVNSTTNDVLKLYSYHPKDSGKLQTRRYDKRDDFNFPIVNFPFIDSNIPAAPAYECHVAGYDYDWETDTCLKLFQTPGVTRKEARTRCLLDGGDLISITAKEKYDFIQNYVNCYTRTMWLGLKGGNWMTGEPFVNKFNFTVLISNIDPDFENDTEHDCVALYFYYVQDRSCNIRLKTDFLCEIRL